MRSAEKFVVETTLTRQLHKDMVVAVVAYAAAAVAADEIAGIDADALMACSS